MSSADVGTDPRKGTPDAIETVADLIAALGDHDDTPVMLVTQPPWPLAHLLATIEQAHDGALSDTTMPFRDDGALAGTQILGKAGRMTYGGRLVR